ncbi:MAG: hypothetical protein Q7U16_16870, partial [Agitococcus sp.]|nr:hypothetical protein [Agitococcus sp.]
YKNKIPGLETIDDVLFRALHPKHKERPSVMEILDVINTFLSTGGKKKVQAIELHSNGKKFTIIKDVEITRDICKSNFGNHEQIYTHQFKIFKDNSGDWFVQGLTVPSTAKAKDGTVLTFYPTIYGGKDITNKPTKLEDNTQLVIGDTQFTVVMK